MMEGTDSKGRTEGTGAAQDAGQGAAAAQGEAAQDAAQGAPAQGQAPGQDGRARRARRRAAALAAILVLCLALASCAAASWAQLPAGAPAGGPAKEVPARQQAPTAALDVRIEAEGWAEGRDACGVLVLAGPDGGEATLGSLPLNKDNKGAADLAPGAYKATYTPPVLADGTVFRAVPVKALSVEECAHGEGYAHKEGGHRVALTIALVPVDAADMTAGLIAEAVKGLPAKERAAAQGRAEARMEAWRKAKAAEDAAAQAEADRRAAEEAAAAAEASAPATGGGYAPAPGGSTGGAPAPAAGQQPPAQSGHWVVTETYICNQCGASFDAYDGIHGHIEAAGNARLNSSEPWLLPQCGGYTVVRDGYWVND